MEEPIRVLVADDDEYIRTLLEEFFKRYYPSWDLTLATNGMQAIKKINEGNYFDLIITDFEMPKEDGISVILAAYAIQGKNSNVLVMSGNKQKFFSMVEMRVEDKLIILDLENKFLGKPFGFPHLKEMIDKIIID